MEGDRRHHYSEFSLRRQAQSPKIGGPIIHNRLLRPENNRPFDQTSFGPDLNLLLLTDLYLEGLQGNVTPADRSPINMLRRPILEHFAGVTRSGQIIPRLIAERSDQVLKSPFKALRNGALQGCPFITDDYYPQVWGDLPKTSNEEVREHVGRQIKYNFIPAAILLTAAGLGILQLPEETSKTVKAIDLEIPFDMLGGLFVGGAAAASKAFTKYDHPVAAAVRRALIGAGLGTSILSFIDNVPDPRSFDKYIHPQDTALQVAWIASMTGIIINSVIQYQIQQTRLSRENKFIKNKRNIPNISSLAILTGHLQYYSNLVNHRPPTNYDPRLSSEQMLHWPGTEEGQHIAAEPDLRNCDLSQVPLKTIFDLGWQSFVAEARRMQVLQAFEKNTPVPDNLPPIIDTMASIWNAQYNGVVAEGLFQWFKDYKDDPPEKGLPFLFPGILRIARAALYHKKEKKLWDVVHDGSEGELLSTTGIDPLFAAKWIDTQVERNADSHKQRGSDYMLQDLKEKMSEVFVSDKNTELVTLNRVDGILNLARFFINRAQQSTQDTKGTKGTDHILNAIKLGGFCYVLPALADLQTVLQFFREFLGVPGLHRFIDSRTEITRQAFSQVQKLQQDIIRATINDIIGNTADDYAKFLTNPRAIQQFSYFYREIYQTRDIFLVRTMDDTMRARMEKITEQGEGRETIINASGKYFTSAMYDLANIDALVIAVEDIGDNNQYVRLQRKIVTQMFGEIFDTLRPGKQIDRDVNTYCKWAEQCARGYVFNYLNREQQHQLIQSLSRLIMTTQTGFVNPNNGTPISEMRQRFSQAISARDIANNVLVDFINPLIDANGNLEPINSDIIESIQNLRVEFETLNSKINSTDVQSALYQVLSSIVA